MSIGHLLNSPFKCKGLIFGSLETGYMGEETNTHGWRLRPFSLRDWFPRLNKNRKWIIVFESEIFY